MFLGFVLHPIGFVVHPIGFVVAFLFVWIDTFDIGLLYMYFFWYSLTFFTILVFTIVSILLLFLDLAGRPSPFFVLGLLCW